MHIEWYDGKQTLLIKGKEKLRKWWHFFQEKNERKYFKNKKLYLKDYNFDWNFELRIWIKYQISF